MGLEVERLAKSYGPVKAVDGVTLAVPSGTTLALLGPSGCGKSTLLRLVAGLERPDAGRVLFDGADVTNVPTRRRDLGMVFQDFALFPHLDVAGNVAFGLVERRVPVAARRARVEELLGLVGLAGLGRRRVHDLSGGQQQRVALARALAPGPALVLLDEPLSNLDEALRAELRDEIAFILRQLETEAIYVTHDQVEAFAIADAVAVMREGSVVQVGPPGAVLASPADAWTARFLGHENVWRGEAAVKVAKAVQTTLGRDEALLLRVDEVRLLPAGAGGTAPEAVVRAAVREGLAWRLELAVERWAQATVVWRGYGRELAGEPAPGDTYALVAPPAAWQVVPDRAP